MSEFNPQFSQFPQLPEQLDSQFADLADMVCRRLEMSTLLERQLGAIPAEGFFTWEAVRQYLQTSCGGILGGGALSAADNAADRLDFTRRKRTERLLIGVSGGADSVALLLLSCLAASRGSCSEIVCCHVNHRLRGEESDCDAQFCAAIAKSLGIDFVVAAANQGQAETFQRQGSEEKLRDFRYEAFQAQALKLGARTIALAHTLNDQVETVLFRSFRGTSSSGLRGIPCVRNHDGIFISRPLIDVSRDQIVGFLRQLGFSWREDSSNAQLHYSRNFIRSEVLPRIESEFPDFSTRVERMRQLIADDEEMLKTLCLSEIAKVESKNANRWELAKLSLLPIAMKRRMFAHALRVRGIEVSFERVDKLVAVSVGNNEISGVEPVKGFSLNERWDVARGKEHLMFVEKDELDAADGMTADPIAVRVPGMTIVPALNKVMFVEALEPSEGRPKKFPGEESFEVIVSLEKVKSPLVIRHRQPGDCIQPFGMQETVKLKKYLHTHKPDEDAAIGSAGKLFVLACGEEVLWVPGVGISEKLRVTGRPTHTIKLLDIGIGDSALC